MTSTKKTSQLTGKAYEESDYTVVIAVVRWLKRIIILQKRAVVVEFWALVSSVARRFFSTARRFLSLPVACGDAHARRQQWCGQTPFCV